MAAVQVMAGCWSSSRVGVPWNDNKMACVGVALVLPCGNFMSYNGLFLWDYNDYTLHKWGYCISTYNWHFRP